MTNRKMKIGWEEFVALITIISLLVVIVIPANVSYASDNVLKDDDLLKNTYAMYMANCDAVELKCCEEGKYWYNVINQTDDGEIVSEVKAYLDDDGNEILEISEPSKKDTIQINKDGTMYLDGEPIIVEVSNLVNNNASVMSAHHISWQTGVPYGNASDYSSLTATENKNFSVAKPIKEMTVSGLITAMCYGMGIASAFGSIAVGAIASGLISWFGRNNSSSKAWSVKDQQFVHFAKGFSVTSSMSVVRHRMTYYSNVNCTSPIDTVVRYEVFTY